MNTPRTKELVRHSNTREPSRPRGPDGKYVDGLWTADFVKALGQIASFWPHLVDRLQRLGPAADGGDDLIWISGPDEGLGVMVGLVETAGDGGLEDDARSEDAALQAPLGERGEEGLDGVEPGARGRGEGEGKAGVAGEPGNHLRLVVGGVVWGE